MASLISSFESIISGLLEGVLATLRHIFNIISGTLKGTLNVSEEVLEHIWKVIEGAVRFVFANLLTLILVGFGAFVGIVLANRQTGAGQKTVSSVKKGGKKRS